MFTSKKQKPLSALVLTTLPLVAVLATCFSANAAESFKLRQSPVASFGGDIATPADKPGFFGTASFTDLTINGIRGADGSTPLSVRSKLQGTTLSAAGLVASTSPLAGITATVPNGTLLLVQDQKQVNLAGGYLTESTYEDGRVAFVANVPFVTQKRKAVISFPNPSYLPAGHPGLSALYPGTSLPVSTVLNAGLQNAYKTGSDNASGEAAGIGDTELSAVWVRHSSRLKVAAGVSLFVPTGKYDVARDAALQANPGFGNFYTIRPGVAFTYNLNPNYSNQDWDAGVTVAGRIAYGINTENKDSKYKSGNYIYTEAAIVKVLGDTAFGLNLFSTQQVTDDRYTGTDITKEINGRYKTLGGGPFFSYKFPGQDMGINFQINRNFAGRNAIDVTSYQLRLIKAF
jgi:hypothetical protein